MKRIWVVPAEGRVLRDHKDSYRQIKEPKQVDLDATMHRRLREGDAIQVADPAEAAKTAARKFSAPKKDVAAPAATEVKE